MINNIQALRGIAALLVVFYHSVPHFTAMGLSNTIFESIGKFGYIGVDIFFVISGYVMAKTSSDVEVCPGNGRLFLGKRFARIYLGYWPIFAMTFLAYFFFRPEMLANKELLQSFFLINSNMFDLASSKE